MKEAIEQANAALAARIACAGRTQEILLSDMPLSQCSAAQHSGVVPLEWQLGVDSSAVMVTAFAVQSIRSEP